MENSWKGKATVTVAILIALGAMLLYFSQRNPERPASSPPENLPKPTPASGQHLPRRSRLAAAPSAAASESNAELANPLALPREKIEEYLKRHQRDAASLLAAYHASFEFDPEHEKGDSNYLKEAAANYPNDPHVQWTVLAHDAFPEDRRKWLDAFKTSSPSNSLANYLSARDFFKNNQPEAAIKELMEASGKAQFADFTLESYLGGEDISRFGGASPLLANTAAMAAMSRDLIPELANWKGVAQGVLEVQKQYLNSGDTAAVQNLSQMSVGLADRLTRGDGGKFIISQLVGMAIEAIALKSLEQNSSYDFLGGKTPTQRMEEFKQQKLMFRELTQTFGSTFVNATEEERASYTDWVQIYGEAAAMRWWQQQHPASTPPGRP